MSSFFTSNLKPTESKPQHPDEKYANKKLEKLATEDKDEEKVEEETKTNRSWIFWVEQDVSSDQV